MSVLGLSRFTFSKEPITKNDMNAAFGSLDFVFMKKMALYCVGSPSLVSSKEVLEK